MKRQPPTPPSTSRFLAGALALSFLLPFVALLVLAALEVPLGEGYFHTRYSPLRGVRTARALPALAIAAIACGAVWLLARRDRSRRQAGVAALIVALIGMGVWAWLAPPKPLTQHMFNLTSPSSDGAFRNEAEVVPSLPRYLRTFSSQRLRLSPREMGGTRVLSNPPGTTAVWHVLGHALRGTKDEPTWLERWLIRHDQVSPEDAPLIADSLRFGIFLVGAWVASGLAAYALGRVFLASAGAAVFAIIVTFNPCTVHFVPGKDPAQLLTINLMLAAWFAGWRCPRGGRGWRRWTWPLCGLAGATLVIGSTFGLIHVWIALAALAATLWHDHRRWRALLRDHVLPAAIGAAIVVVVAWLAIGWNVPETLLAVSRRWNELQKTFEMNRAVWFVIGLPIFLLFLSPGVWTLGALAARRRRLNVGTRLALCTVGVMALIYVVIGTTYELPRLWVAFLPPLMLGLAIDQPLLRGRGQHPRATRALMLLVLTQIAFTAFHWTFLDAREAEYRLLSQRYFE